MEETREMTKFFISDTHFNHENIIRFCNRPFQNALEMNEVLINNWNAKVKNGDIVYHAGDFGYGELREILDRLNGKIYYIPSHEWTHEQAVLKYKDHFAQVSPLMNVSIRKGYGVSITICHYCMRKWAKEHYNHWHLFGHSHGRLEPIGKSWDIGVDNNDYFPLSLEEIAKIMENRPDNPGYNSTQIRRRNKCSVENVRTV